jgi:hypothetical protein
MAWKRPRVRRQPRKTDARLVLRDTVRLDRLFLLGGMPQLANQRRQPDRLDLDDSAVSRHLTSFADLDDVIKPQLPSVGVLNDAVIPTSLFDL